MTNGQEALKKALLSLQDDERPWTLEDYVVKCLKEEEQHNLSLWERLKELAKDESYIFWFWKK